LGLIAELPFKGMVAAVSCGLYQGEAVLDLDYDEDSNAQADTNFVLTDSNQIVEIQGTAEDNPFSEDQLASMMAMAKKGIGELIVHQKNALEIG
jgi:ribonuclease PH